MKLFSSYAYVVSLSENNNLEELNLAGNAVPNELLTHKERLPMIVDDTQEALCVLNTDYHQLEVADSEDTQVRAEAAASGVDDSCASSYQRNSSSPKCQFIRQLFIAIGMAKNLHLLDISDNGFAAEDAESFYSSWSSTSRTISSHKHITERIIHFSTKENKCCKVKPCCKKD